MTQHQKQTIINWKPANDIIIAARLLSLSCWVQRSLSYKRLIFFRLISAHLHLFHSRLLARVLLLRESWCFVSLLYYCLLLCIILFRFFLFSWWLDGVCGGIVWVSFGIRQFASFIGNNVSNAGTFFTPWKFDAPGTEQYLRVKVHPVRTALPYFLFSMWPH